MFTQRTHCGTWFLFSCYQCAINYCFNLNNQKIAVFRNTAISLVYITLVPRTSVCAINWCLTLSYFLTEYTITYNHEPNATPPSTVIAATDNHSLPPLPPYQLCPHPFPHISSGNIASTYWRSVSSPQSGSTTPMFMSIYCSRWVSMSSELERRQCRGGGGAGYLVFLWLGPSYTVPKFSPLRRSPRRRRTRRKKVRGVKSMKRTARDCWMSSLLLRGGW